MAKRRPQKGKDGKRPRAFHRGRAQGRINDRVLQTKLEPAYERAETDHVEVEKNSTRARAEVRDHQALIAQLDHVAPFVPRLAA